MLAQEWQQSLAEAPPSRRKGRRRRKAPCGFYYIALYSVLFCSILFCSILFYYSILSFYDWGRCLGPKLVFWAWGFGFRVGELDDGASLAYMGLLAMGHQGTMRVSGSAVFVFA